MSIEWRLTTVLTALIAGVGSLAMGCGPSPAYYEEPRTPVMYEPPAPLSSEELAARQQAQQQEASAQAQADLANPQPQAGDVQIGATADEYTDADPSALTEFKPALDGHGRWVDDSTYGTVWVPSSSEVGTDFQPYVTAGHWTYSESESWVWVSEYEWGWAPFHYGRWVQLNGYGWSWIPGRTYSGAWVVWRTGAYGYDYVGWAPAGPDYYWYGGYPVAWGFGWYAPPYYYCHHDYLWHEHVGHYGYSGSSPRGQEIAGHTAPYHPASPGVGGAGGRVAASPTVGSTGAAGRVGATPGVGGAAGGGGGGSGGAMTTRGANGPKPSDVGVANGKLGEPPTNNKGLERAHAMSTPATATKLGAAPPSTLRPRRVEPSEAAIAGMPRGGGDRGPSASSAFANNRIEPAARSPQYSGSQGSPSMPQGHPLPGGLTAAMQQPSSGSSSAPRSFSTAPASSPSFQQPRSASPSRVAETPRSSPTPSHSSTPTFTPRSSQASSPSMRSSSPSPSVSHAAAPTVSHPSSAVRSTHSSSPSRSSRGGKR